MRDNAKSGALTEVTFYILLSLYTPKHGYAVMQFVEEKTGGRLSLGAGTLYGALNSLQDKKWIKPYGDSEGRKKEYHITAQGKEIAHIYGTVNKEYVKDDYDGGDTVQLYTLDGKCNISGERIKSARAKAKLTQDQLAARLQVAGLQMGQMAISRIESGKRLVPDFELPIIAEALNVSIDWLLGIEKE